MCYAIIKNGNVDDTWENTHDVIISEKQITLNNIYDLNFVHYEQKKD